MKEYDQIIKEKGLPNPGQTVRSKKYGTLWRVLEKKEIWQNIEPDPKTGETRMVPAIYLSYWKVREGTRPATWLPLCRSHPAGCPLSREKSCLCSKVSGRGAPE